MIYKDDLQNFLEHQTILYNKYRKEYGLDPVERVDKEKPLFVSVYSLTNVVDSLMYIFAHDLVDIMCLSKKNDEFLRVIMYFEPKVELREGESIGLDSIEFGVPVCLSSDEDIEYFEKWSKQKDIEMLQKLDTIKIGIEDHKHSRIRKEEL